MSLVGEVTVRRRTRRRAGVGQPDGEGQPFAIRRRLLPGWPAGWERAAVDGDARAAARREVGYIGEAGARAVLREVHVEVLGAWVVGCYRNLDHAAGAEVHRLAHAGRALSQITGRRRRPGAARDSIGLPSHGGHLDRPGSRSEIVRARSGRVGREATAAADFVRIPELDWRSGHSRYG